MPIKIVVSEILLPSKISDLGRNREMSNTKLASLKNLSQLTENLVSERFYIDWEIANNYFPRPAILNPASDVCNDLKELVEPNEMSMR